MVSAVAPAELRARHSGLCDHNVHSDGSQLVIRRQTSRLDGCRHLAPLLRSLLRRSGTRFRPYLHRPNGVYNWGNTVFLRL